MLPFALSIFAGAFLLFSVQPLVGKYILPWFGGGPGVWTTCLLFFQTALLGGYLYAHLASTRLTPRRQALLHLALIVVALAALPIVPSAHWKPADGADPIGRILLLLTVSVGLPYFVLSATGPLLQQWFSLTQPDRSPYRLYALSNVGSLLALLAYPFFFERVFSRQTQATLWSAGLVLYAASCAWCARRLWKTAPAISYVIRMIPSDTASDAAHAPTPPLDRLLWFSLPAIASVLLLATTNKLCQDLAVIPFLWVLPLSLYLLSFILCFDHPRWYSRPLFSGLFMLGTLVDLHLLTAGHHARLPQQIAGYSATLFAACMLCHGELFRLRPGPRQLTSFYLFIAAGGAAGSFLVAVVAPLLFDRYLELQLGLWLLSYFLAIVAWRQRSVALVYGAAGGAFGATLVVPMLEALARHTDTPVHAINEAVVVYYRDNWSFVCFLAAAFLGGALTRRGWLREWQIRLGNFLLLSCIGLGVLLLVQIRQESAETIFSSRDFYGVLTVREHEADTPDLHYFSLVHGVTTHGLQFALAPQSGWPTTYYTETSGLGLAIASVSRDPRRGGRRLGMVGLGTGTVASYGEAGDTVRIYEIDPQVPRIARSHFSFVTHSPAHVEIVMGDARLSMERELARGQPQQFDVLALDAFSSDAIPVHLLTVEAFTTYFAHLRPGGIVAVHTSNRYLDLEPVVENLARHFGYEAAVISDNPPAKKWWAFRSTWILVTKNRAFLDRDEVRLARDDTPSTRRVGLWTDDHASVYEILK